MTFPEIIKVITNIEQSVDVQGIRCSGVQIWPLIRLQIWQQLSSPERPGRFGAHKPGRRKRLNRLLDAIIRPNKYPSADALFVIGPNERRVRVDGHYYSQYADSLNDLTQKQGLRAYTLDLDDKVHPVYGAPVRLSRDIGSLWEKAMRRLNRPNVRLDTWKALLAYLRVRHPNIRLDRDRIVRDVQSIRFNEQRFERILKKAQPRAIFLVCYYHPAAMGCIRACRKLGIKAVEVQHGQQGDYHGMYTNWTNLPAHGYDTMPTHFWCWGQRSADRINEWLPDGQAFVGGNPWLATQKSTIIRPTTKDGKTHILLALQPVPEPLSSFVVQAIASSPDTMQWHIGLHPRMKDREHEVRTLLGTIVDRVDFELDKHTPLYDTLARMDFLLTQWSTVAYEALAFGVHPIIVHPNGRMTFQEYIDKGLFSYADDTDKLLAVLKQDPESFPLEEETPYMVSNIKHIKKTLIDVIAP